MARTLLAIQLLWSALGLAVAMFFLYHGALLVGLPAILAAAFYTFVAVATYRRKRWAWWASLLPAAICVLLVGPNVLYNLYAFASGHPLYLDSPGTILVVGLYAIVFLIPAVAVAWLLAKVRGDVFV